MNYILTIILCIIFYFVGFDRGINRAISIIKKQAIEHAVKNKSKKIYVYAKMINDVIYVYECDTDRFIIQGVNLNAVVNNYLASGGRDSLCFDPESADLIGLEYNKESI